MVMSTREKSRLGDCMRERKRENLTDWIWKEWLVVWESIVGFYGGGVTTITCWVCVCVCMEGGDYAYGRHGSYGTSTYNNSLLWTYMLMRHESHKISTGDTFLCVGEGEEGDNNVTELCWGCVVTTTTIELLWFGRKLFYAPLKGVK